MEQAIRFCTTEDGVRIAYATTGKGPPIVRPGHWLTHLEYDLKSPVWGHLIEGLSEHHQLVRYDPRGTGCSERNVAEVSHELWAKDLEAVVNDLALERFALLGISQGGPTAIRYCINFPERVSHLILYGSWARGRLRRDAADPSGNRPEMFEAMCTMVREGWGSDSERYRELFSSMYVPDGNREHIRFLNELEKVSASPAMAEKYLRALVTIDVRSLLPQVKAPTLVLHCRGDRTASINLGRELAAGIPGAKFVPMEGDNHVFLEGEPARKTFFQEVSRFLGDKPHLISKGALKRQARGFNATMQHLHHVIHPYYVIIAVASAVFGLVSFVLTKIV
jgi:pimeloyl-ACP methyl ester carboxylesterase